MDRRALLLGAMGGALGCRNPAGAAQEPRGGAPPADPAARPEFDLLLRGGRVLDPAADLDAVRDVAIRDGKIAAVARGIAPRRARRTISVEGLLVMPGLVDLHVHGFGYQGSLALDEHCLPNGTTTVVDAGGAGWRTCDAFIQAITPRLPRFGGGFPGGGSPGAGPGGGTPGTATPGGAPGGRPPGAGGPGVGGPGAGFNDPARRAALFGARPRILAFLNIVGQGMVGGRAENDMADMDPERAAACVLAHPELLVGIKTAHFGGPRGPAGWTAVDHAVRAGEQCRRPVMVDFDPREDRPYSELILKRLRPGDLHTHVYAQHIPLLDEAGRVQPYVWEARRRGVLFDVGHGGGSFWFRVAAPAIRQGFLPDSISTDLHRSSLLIPQATMPLVMSKLLNLGMPLREVVRRSTVQPALQIGRRELGTLAPGSGADVAVFELEEGEFGFVDSGHARMEGRRRLRCHLTLRDGVVAYDLNGLAWTDWRSAGSYRTLDQYGEERRRGFRRPPAAPPR